VTASNDRPVRTSVEPLTQVLAHLPLEGIFYCRSELSAPWGLELPPMTDCIWFHVVTRGSCRLSAGSGEPFEVRRGDLVLLPRGRGHSVSSDGEAECAPVMDLPHDYLSERYALLRHGGGGAQVDLVCGAVQLSDPAGRAVVEALPEVIHVDSSSDRDALEWLPAILGMLAAEAAEPRPGGEVVVTRLCDVLIVRAIRGWLESDPGAHTGWLGALGDPQIGTVVASIHAEPGREWTVQGLAASASMSRSAFSARFSELVGEGPMSYVTRWRMLVAADLLGREGLTVATVAERLGYGSEAAFGRAYKRTTGGSPGAVRRRAGSPEFEEHG